MENCRLSTDNISMDGYPACGRRIEDDCHDGIALFNGTIGKTKEIVHPNSPHGLKVHEKTDSGLVISTSLDNCASQEEVKHFVKKLFFLDFKTLKLTAIKGAP